MKRLFGNKLLWAAGIVVCFGTALVMFGLQLRAKQQDDERSIHVMAAQHRLCPVLITRVSIGAQGVQCGLLGGSPQSFGPVVPFHASGDWLTNVTVRLINRTDKVIVAAELNVVFRDTGDCSKAAPCSGYPIQVGEITPGVEKATFGNGTPIDWRPNDSIEIHFSDYIGGFREQLEQQMPIEDIHKVDLHTGPFYFADGMRWGGGADFAIPQPGSPGKFTILDRGFFPGNKYLNWPPLPGIGPQHISQVP